MDEKNAANDHIEIRVAVATRICLVKKLNVADLFYHLYLYRFVMTYFQFAFNLNVHSLFLILPSLLYICINQFNTEKVI